MIVMGSVAVRKMPLKVYLLDQPYLSLGSVELFKLEKNTLQNLAALPR